MAQNPYINKVEYAGQTLMDLTGDTATPSDVLNGKTFHDRSGSPQTGNLITHNVYDGLDSSSSSDALSANQGKILNEGLKNRTFAFSEGVQLSNGTNINEITTYGCYRIISIDVAETMTNLPIATAGALFVKNAMNMSSTSYVQQIFIPYYGKAIYIRATNNPAVAWNEWSIIGEDDGWWDINIPRATFTTVANNMWHRQGNIVFCETCINITASQSGNAYIGSDCIPKFGLALGNAFGVWHDYDADKSGTLAGYSGGNIWMALNGNGPASLTAFVGHKMGITLTAFLH